MVTTTLLQETRDMYARLGRVVVRLPDRPGYDLGSWTTVDMTMVDQFVSDGVLRRDGGELRVTDPEAFTKARDALACTCDFCCNENASWLYPTTGSKSFAVVADDVSSVWHNDDSDWLACDTCAGLIEQDDRTTLAARGARSFTEKFPAEVPIAEREPFGPVMLNVQSVFFGRRNGERVPL